MASKKKAMSSDAGEVIVKPLSRMWGLDNIHVALVILVVLLLAMLLLVSYGGGPTLVNNTCSYGTLNGTCVIPVHNASEVRAKVQHILATYNSASSWQSLIPYFSEVSNMSISFMPSNATWLAELPLRQPNASVVNIAFVLYDSNLSLRYPLVQMQAPNVVLSNSVVSKGVVQLANKFACAEQTPMQMFWFMDPYAPGAIASLRNLSTLESAYGSRLNASVKIVFGSDSGRIADAHGVNDTQALSEYVLCASQQSNFTRFVSTLNSAFGGSFISPQSLAGVAQASRLDTVQLNACLANSSVVINKQSLLAKYYNVTSTPIVVTDCEYMAIPQTAQASLCYVDKSFC